MKNINAAQEHVFLNMFPMETIVVTWKIRPLEAVGRIPVKTTPLSSASNAHIQVSNLNVGLDYRDKPTHLKGEVAINLKLLKEEGGSKKAFMDLNEKVKAIIEEAFPEKKKKPKRDRIVQSTLSFDDMAINIVKNIVNRREVLEDLRQKGMSVRFVGNDLVITVTREPEL